MGREKNKRDCIYKKKLLSRTLIGLKVKILLHNDPSLRNIEGEIVQETKKSIIVRKNQGEEITILKLYGLFVLGSESGPSVIVHGEDIYGTLLERLRRIRKRRVVC